MVRALGGGHDCRMAVDPGDSAATIAQTLAEYAEPIPPPQLREVPLAVRRRTPEADAADPLYETNPERIWTDAHLSTVDRVQVVLGDLHQAARLLGDPDSARLFLNDVSALTVRDQWFATDDVAAAAREFVATWHVGGPILVEDLDAQSEQFRVAGLSYERDDELAATAYEGIRRDIESAL